MANISEECQETILLLDSDEEERLLSLQAKAAARAIGKSMQDGKTSATVATHKASSPPARPKPVQSSKFQAGELDKCNVKLVRLESDQQIKKLLGSNNEDMHKKIADCMLTMKVAPAILKQCLDGRGKERGQPSEGPAAKQRRIDVKVATGCQAFNRRKTSPAVSTPNVKYVVVAPKPGAPIVKWTRPHCTKRGKLETQLQLGNAATLQTDKQTKVSTEPMMFRCQFCLVSCNTLNNLLNHKRKAHRDKAGFHCYGCGSSFQTMADLHDHTHDCEPVMSSPVEPSYAQNKSFHSVIAVFPDNLPTSAMRNQETQLQPRNAAALQTDAQTSKKVSTESPMFRCQLCPVSCNSVRNLLNHKRMAHKDEGGFHCYSCGSSYETIADLHAHDCEPLKPCAVESSNTQSVKATFQPRTQQIIIAEPNGKYTSLNKMKVEEPVSKASGSRYWKVSCQSRTGQATCETGVEETGFQREAQMDTISNVRQINFVCESCLAAFPSNAALEAHICSASLMSLEPVSQNVPFEVEQLAKFYSSVVFQDS